MAGVVLWHAHTTTMDVTKISPSLAAFLDEAYDGADAAHDKMHALRVHENMCWIVQEEGMELSERERVMMPYVSTMHDILDHKRPIAKRPREALVLQWLVDELNGDREVAEEIMYIHRNCSWSKRNDSEPLADDRLRLLLQDADWLEALGEVGLERCVAFSKAIGVADVEANVRKHIQEKLLFIPGALNFEASRQKAKTLMEPLVRYLCVTAQNK
jgi:hypothetical protein